MSGTPDTKEDNIEMPGMWANFIGVILASLPRILPIAWIKYWLNHGEELRDKFAALFKDDPRFEEIGSFLVVVPDGYNHGTVIADLRREHGKRFCYWNKHINDADLANSTTVLTPGRKFKVKMFAIKRRQTVPSQDCLKVIAANKGIFTGAQGAALAYKQGESYMTRTGKGFASFVSKNLPLLNGLNRVPFVNVRTDGRFDFFFRYFELDWDDQVILLCFCDEES